MNLFQGAEKRLHGAIRKDVQRNPLPSSFQIVEIHETDDMKSHISKRNPIVFRNAAKNWNCCKEWSLNYFEETFGDYVVTLQDNIGLTDRDNPQTLTKIKMRDYISEVRNKSKRYLKFSRVIRDEKILQKYFDLDALKSIKNSNAFSNNFYFFIGGEGTKTPIHNGFSTTIFIQVEGRKKWIFYAPEDRFFLGVRPERRSYYYSDANPLNPNMSEFPLFDLAQAHEVILEPGDILWFPPLAFHQVENLSDSIGVAYKAVDIPLAFYSSKIMSTLFFLATRPNIFTAYFGNRVYDNDYIFSTEDESFKLKTVE